MKLNNVVIKNFRSIENASLSFSEDPARVLVGINESGKSNILKAMSLLAPDVPVNPQDRRVERSDEQPVTESRVLFEFLFNEEETAQIRSAVFGNFIEEELKYAMVTDGKKELSISDFFDIRIKHCLYRIDILKGTKGASYYNRDKKYEVLDGWSYLEGVPETDIYRRDGLPTVFSPETKFINQKSYTFSESIEFKKITIATLDKLIIDEMHKVLAFELPKCIYWKYEEKNILPVQIDIEGFQTNPDTCIPLKNCFELAGYADVSGALAAARAQTRQALMNLLNRVGDKTTTYLQAVWKDYKNVVIEFHPDGNFILPVVKDKRISFDFLQRSDGFKRFISFLLMISSQVSTAKIKNTLILIDEPEIGLHPTGARNLMQELFKVAASNYVVYSTHSIFMIDRDNIKRHVIVEKKSEITELRGAEQSRLADEEVLYKAIGFSLLEILGARNVLFEGWRDKSLFFATRKAFVKKHKDLVSNQDKNLSVCHAEGVKDVRNIAPIIELSGRSLSIVSDSDQAAKEHQRKHTDAQIYGDWRTYEDITGDSSFVTAEDFIRPEVVINRLAPFGKRYADLPELLPGQLDHPRGTLYVIDSWIGRVVDGEKSQILHEIKTALFDSLKVDDIAEEYVAVLKFIYGLDNAEPNEG